MIIKLRFVNKNASKFANGKQMSTYGSGEEFKSMQSLKVIHDYKGLNILTRLTMKRCKIFIQKATKKMSHYIINSVKYHSPSQRCLVIDYHREGVSSICPRLLLIRSTWSRKTS